MIVLAFETSCDESSVAVVADGKVVSMRTVTQSVHRRFGGVVPELAGRSHLQLVDRLTLEALAGASISASEIDLVAATVGPGLVGSLLVGSNYARGLALAINKPYRGIHHLEAHLWSAEIEHGALPLPFLLLLVSGGHTMLVLVEGPRHYRVLGASLDDALGEAYDKVGKLFGLGFPAGAAVDKLAASGVPSRHVMTPPKLDGSLDFSFSGLKTAVLYQVRELKQAQIVEGTPDVLFAFQESALASVEAKVRRAAELSVPRSVVAAGGVAANSRLRTILGDVARDFGVPCLVPSPRYCMDNAGMIGYLASKLESAAIHDHFGPVKPRWPLEELS